MPTKMAKICKEKLVFITVYVEKPRRRRESANQRRHHHHHHHYLHHANNQEVKRGSGKGYSRRAELLRYSQSLRESARSAAFSSPPSSSSTTLLLPKPTSPKNQPPTTNTVALRRKPSHPRTPTCMGNWKFLVPSFIWSLTSPKAEKARKKKKHDGSTTNKMKALMKSLEIQKRRLIIPKLFSAFRKRK